MYGLAVMLSISKLTTSKNIDEIIYVVCRSHKPIFSTFSSLKYLKIWITNYLVIAHF